MKRHITINTSDMICPECGRNFPIIRAASKTREKGHIKDLYCPFCKKDQKFREIRSIDFIKEV